MSETPTEWQDRLLARQRAHIVRLERERRYIRLEQALAGLRRPTPGTPGTC
jgi:hypothetical protein